MGMSDDLEDMLHGKRDWNSLYQQIGRLLENAPDIDHHSELKEPETMRWMGRARVLVERTGGNTVAFDAAIAKFPFSNWHIGVHEIMQLVYVGLAVCESRVPAAMAGSFIPIGNSFDAFAALGKIFRSAKADILVVDPYMDETALTEFGTTVADGARLRLLSDQATWKASLGPAAQKWKAQHGAKRPLEVRLAPPKALHDRALFVDSAGAWTLTQSLKDFAKRSPAEIVRADDTAALKIAAYEQIWLSSTVVV